MTWWWLVPLALVALMLRVHLFGRRTFDASPRDALIVLGARVLPDGTPSEALVARVERGVQLFQQGLAPRLVISGGGAGETSEAAIGRELALRAGVPESACLIETKSGSTFANAVHSVELLRPLGVTRVFVVTDDFHAFRAAAHFRRRLRRRGRFRSARARLRLTALVDASRSRGSAPSAVAAPLSVVNRPVAHVPTRHRMNGRRSPDPHGGG